MRRTAMMIMFIALVVTACGGGTPAGSGSPTTAGSSDAASGDFLSLAQRGFSEGSFKVTIEITSTGGTGSDSTSSITWAQRGDEASYRIGEGADATLIIDPGDGSGQIFCTGDSCYRSPESGGDLGQGLLGPLTGFSELVKGAGDLPGFSSTGSRTIAGRTAECASWDYQGFGDNEMCIDAELGVMLSWSYSSPDGSTATWEVVEFSEPGDEDFEPTGDVQVIPSGEPSY